MHLLPRSLCVVLAPALLCVAALAQETGEKPRLPALGPNAGDGGRAEMVGLFHKVERRLGEIDKLLYDASTGHSALQSQKESGIADLIKSSSAKSKCSRVSSPVSPSRFAKYARARRWGALSLPKVTSL